MNALNVVTRAHYGNKRWKKVASMFFAERENVAPIGMSEFPKAMMTMAIGFMTFNDRLTPVVLQGLVSGQNWFVAHDGKWLGNYIPAIYSCYPFRLIKAENNELVLCIDETSGLVMDNPSAIGEVFFDDKNDPSPLISRIVNDLTNIEQDSQKSQLVCSVIQKHNLLEPWPIQLKADAGMQTIEGLSRINERALNSLPADALIELRDSGALLVIYGQLFSMQNLQKLGKLASIYGATRNKPVESNVDPGLLEDSGSISFDNL